MSFEPGDASNSHVSSSGLVLFFVGATRSVNVNVATNATTTTIQCESGDMLAFEGDCGSAIRCEVSSLPIDLRNRPSGIAAITYVIRLEWSKEHACSGGVTFTPQTPCPLRFPAWTAYGALGVDVEARESGLPNTGLGLFLLRDYPRGGIVTEYDGALRHVRKVSGKRKLAEMTLSSHWRSLPGCDLVIEGISEFRGLFNGRGGASLANHKTGREANSKFEIIWTERDRIPRFCEDDGCHYVVPRIVLTLLKPAFKGDELFVDYGEDTAKRFLLSSPYENQGKLGRKCGSSPFDERLIFNASGQRATSASGVVTQPLPALTVQASLVGEVDDIDNQSLGEMVCF